jgi:hypothetical protein
MISQIKEQLGVEGVASKVHLLSNTFAQEPILLDWFKSWTYYPFRDTVDVFIDGVRAWSLDATKTSGWSPNLPAASTSAISITYVGEVCNRDSLSTLTGLAIVQSSNCAAYDQQVQWLVLEGASGVVFIAPDEWRSIMTPSDPSFVSTVPVTMIDQEPGYELISLLSSGRDVKLQLRSRDNYAYSVAIDRSALPAEVGYVDWLDDMYVILLEAQGFDFRWGQLLKREQLRETADVISVMVHSTPVNTVVNLSSLDATNTYTHFYVWYEAECPSGFAASCPKWDKQSSLYICSARQDEASCDDDVEAVEVLRMISAYRRGSLALIDASPFLYLFLQDRYKYGSFGRFRVFLGAPDSFLFTVEFFFVSAPEPSLLNLVPVSATKLWSGTLHYDQYYNSANTPYVLTIPSSTQAIAAVSYITGHGWGKDEENCAEFCPHSHCIHLHNIARTSVFVYNSSNPRADVDLYTEYTIAGTDLGCMEQVAFGVTPNQYGTWYFGRGGWCALACCQL